MASVPTPSRAGPLPASSPLTRWHWAAPLAILATGTLAAWFSDVDLALSALYFDVAGPEYWPTGLMPPWSWLYRYGEAPAVLMAVGSLLGLAAAYTATRFRGWRAPAWIVLLALTLGPLLVTNALLKEHWGRPRPRQVEAFGGGRPYQPVLMPTFRADENGFPSGHVAAGFAPVALYFAWRGRRGAWARAALAVAVVYGLVMGWARITQGAHFASDVLWSGGVVYFSALAAAAGVQRWLPASRAGVRLPDRPWRALIWLATVSLAGLVLFYYVWRLPGPKAERRPWPPALAASQTPARMPLAPPPSAAPARPATVAGMPGDSRP
ncbi:MAG: phosphatase PAP2 family protein [Candidatus Lambdaproteobacteria bacterium]|nr:phosphatase PAP2 family protein [Candidatus Lambdaproteobacteria bacterium]